MALELLDNSKRWGEKLIAMCTVSKHKNNCMYTHRHTNIN